MKKLLLSFVMIFMMLFATTSNAQMVAGSIAPDFTATDINGTSWNLYSLLDSGKTVYLDIFATWCGPCWSYHTSGALDGLFNQYGPSATNSVRAFMVEGDAATTLADLHGTGTNTQGDWVTGTPMPILDNAGIANSYQITYYPTVYMICPDRVIREVGQLTTPALYAARGTDCSFATAATDAGIAKSMTALNGILASCQPVSIGYRLANYGTDPLTSATITLSVNGSVAQTYNWTGSLTTYQSVVLSFNGVSGNVGTNSVSVAVSNPNGLTDANAANNSSTYSFTTYSSIGGPAVMQNYAIATFPPTGWSIVNGGSASYTWTRNTTAGFNGAGCAKMDFWSSPNHDVDAMVLPAMDLSTTTSVVMTFDVSNAQYQFTTGLSQDNLKIKVSTNCGNTWTTTAYNKSGNFLQTAGTVSTAFTPTTPSQWRSETVTLSQFSGNPNFNNVFVKFEGTSNNGNNLYVDNVNVTFSAGISTPVSIAAFNLFPNPATSRAEVDFDTQKKSDVTIEVYNKIGDLVYSYTDLGMVAGEHTFELNTDNYAKGVYMVNIKTNEGSSMKKLVIE